jgi:SpoIID/LytB domain protein
MIVNVVALEAYLQGVVPGEMPKEWPLPALAAQAVAARTYAVAGILTGKPYDLYSDYRSQVYYGVDSEAPSTTRAVKQTRGRILTFDEEPAQTLYFSSSGGRTKSAVDMFGNDLPYLTEVDDPWDDVPENPNHSWEPLALTGRQLASKLGVSAPVTGVTAVPGAQGKPAAMRFATGAGSVVEKRISDLRWVLGLRSSSFRIGVLRLTRPAGPVAGGTKVTLSGLAQDVDEPLLERRAPAGWKRVTRLKPHPDGTFSVPLRPSTTTTFRVSAEGVPGPSVTLKVTEAAR